LTWEDLESPSAFSGTPARRDRRLGCKQFERAQAMLGKSASGALGSEVIPQRCHSRNVTPSALIEDVHD
jgi:hypothetical protein